jgi:hypothetical protein
MGGIGVKPEDVRAIMDETGKLLLDSPKETSAHQGVPYDDDIL